MSYKFAVALFMIIASPATLAEKNHWTCLKYYEVKRTDVGSNMGAVASTFYTTDSSNTVMGQFHDAANAAAPRGWIPDRIFCDRFSNSRDAEQLLNKHIYRWKQKDAPFRIIDF